MSLLRCPYCPGWFHACTHKEIVDYARLRAAIAEWIDGRGELPPSTAEVPHA